MQQQRARSVPAVRATRQGRRRQVNDGVSPYSKECACVRSRGIGHESQARAVRRVSQFLECLSSLDLTVHGKQGRDAHVIARHRSMSGIPTCVSNQYAMHAKSSTTPWLPSAGAPAVRRLACESRHEVLQSCALADDRRTCAVVCVFLIVLDVAPHLACLRIRVRLNLQRASGVRFEGDVCGREHGGRPADAADQRAVQHQSLYCLAGGWIMQEHTAFTKTLRLERRQSGLCVPAAYARGFSFAFMSHCCPACIS